MDESRVPATIGHVCCACGAVHVCCACGAAAGANKGVSCERRGDTWFCADCWRHLPANEVERIVREVALRGVPL